MLLMAPRLQLQCSCHLGARVGTLYQQKDSTDVGAEAREERQLGPRQGIMPVVDVIDHEQDLAAELLGRL